jgi:shikimate kinase
MSKKKIFLCGFMGCGKSTCGKAASGVLGVAFTDLDEQVEMSANKPIAEVFEQDGEAFFRKIEAITLTMVCGIDSANHIVALGGGAITNDINTELINECGVIVFIDTDFDICYERIKNDSSRPLTAKSREELQELYDNRKKIYMKNAHRTIDGNNDIDTIVKEIVKIHADL